MLSTLVVLQHAVAAGGREKERPPLHIVGMVRRPETVDVANYLVGAVSIAHDCLHVRMESSWNAAARSAA